MASSLTNLQQPGLHTSCEGLLENTFVTTVNINFSQKNFRLSVTKYLFLWLCYETEYNTSLQVTRITSMVSGIYNIYLSKFNINQGDRKHKRKIVKSRRQS